MIRSPQLNPHLFGVVKISAGNEHALALTKSGELYSWGSANLTGHGDSKNRHVPMILDKWSSDSEKVVQISCGGLHSMVVTNQGYVYCWGSNEGA